MDMPKERQPGGQKTPREEQINRFFDAVRQFTTESPIRALDATFRRLALARIADARPLKGEPDADRADRRHGALRKKDEDQCLP